MIPLCSEINRKSGSVSGVLYTTGNGNAIAAEAYGPEMRQHGRACMRRLACSALFLFACMTTSMPAMAKGVVFDNSNVELSDQSAPVISGNKAKVALKRHVEPSATQAKRVETVTEKKPMICMIDEDDAPQDL